MRIDAAASVRVQDDLHSLWARLVHVSAVADFLGEGARDVGPLADESAGTAGGHSFTIPGVGGGRFHARVEHLRAHGEVRYLVWRDRIAQSAALLTYQIERGPAGLELKGSLAMDMPVEELLPSFGLLGALLAPLAPKLLQSYMTRRFEAHLARLSG